MGGATVSLVASTPCAASCDKVVQVEAEHSLILPRPDSVTGLHRISVAECSPLPCALQRAFLELQMLK